MDGNSETAFLSAVLRGLHTQGSDDPILPDPYAPDLYTQAEAESIADVAVDAALSPDQRAELGDEYTLLAAAETCLEHAAFAAAIIARNRYAEDCLEAAVREHGIEQYVIVGAGLDTFVFRRPELAEQLTVIELDHPDSQRDKLERLEAAGLEPPESLHFVPVDLEEESVASALSDTPYDPDRPAFFAWLGVSVYLSMEAIFTTVDSIRSCSGPGSRLVFDFIDTAGANREATTDRIRRLMDLLDQLGEPIRNGLDLATFESEMEDRGYRVRELLRPADQRERYFADRADPLGPTEHYHFAHLSVDE